MFILPVLQANRHTPLFLVAQNLELTPRPLKLIKEIIIFLLCSIECAPLIPSVLMRNKLCQKSLVINGKPVKMTGSTKLKQCFMRLKKLVGHQ